MVLTTLLDQRRVNRGKLSKSAPKPLQLASEIETSYVDDGGCPTRE